MFFLGIDIAKNTHVASMADESNKPVFKAFSCSNTSDGGESLLAKLEKHGITNENLAVGLEATGHYWLSVYSFYRKKDLNFMSSILSKPRAGVRGWRFAIGKPTPLRHY